jgi:soluble lytic murein transglycosylase-like protein
VSVARVESNLDHEARSPAGARGLLQVMPPTAAELRLDPDRPASNVLAGARYLKQMLGRFGSANLALAAYKRGTGSRRARGRGARRRNAHLRGERQPSLATSPGLHLS